VLVLGIVVESLGVLVGGLVVAAVALPHRRASVPTSVPGATAGKRATRVVP
jgi:hypothetical protein